MAKSIEELATEMVVAMIEKELIIPPNEGDTWTTEVYAREAAKAFRTVYDAVRNPREH